MATACVACTYCGTDFTSKNRLFTHLRNSGCSAQAAVDGLEGAAKKEKIALIIGRSSQASDWRTLLWRAIDIARGVGIFPGRESYADRGAPGHAFAIEELDASQVPCACDVLSFSTELLSPETEQEAWCARVNAALPHDIRVLGRSSGLSPNFCAARCCIRRSYVCFLPMQLLLVDAGSCLEGHQHDDDKGNVDERSKFAKFQNVTTTPKKHSKREHEAGWGEGDDGELLLGQFSRFKTISRTLQGEKLCHNLSSRVGLCPRDAAARRHIYKCRALTNSRRGVTGFSVSVDSILVGQLRAMAGLAVAFQHGLLPEAYLDEVFSADKLVTVPRVPLGTELVSGCVFNKEFHHKLRPLMECGTAHAWRENLEQSLITTALEGQLEAWFLNDLAEFSSSLRLVAPAISASRDRPSSSLITGDEGAHLYAEVLRLLREAESSGRWPGISKGREKVIKSSTLAENGGLGGSFTLGSMPPPLETPSANALFPELAFRAFELESFLRPGRPPSSTIAVNKRAQFVPHLDSGAGAGQGTSLIVGLGDYTGGELVVEGIPYDIRYEPLEFDGWTQRHWTLPFEGERFSLVWFTPVGCEEKPGLQICAKTSAFMVSSANMDSDNIAECDGDVICLRNGLKLPRLGFGTWQIGDHSASTVIHSALDAGYRLFDTASIYKNEVAVGLSIKRWEGEFVDKYGSDAALPRVMVTSKCSPYEMGFERALDACAATLQRLGRDSVDLYLIHWPALPRKPHSSIEHRQARHDTWRALEFLYHTGKARAIGVSNFTTNHLKQLLEDGVEEVPMVNQIEAHPLHLQVDVIKFCSEHRIVVQAYSPLGAGPNSNVAKATGGVVDGTRILTGHGVVQKIASEMGRSPAQVLLRWGLQKDFVVIPRSCNPARINENAQIFDFALSEDQMLRLDALRDLEATAQKFCWDPATIL